MEGLMYYLSINVCNKGGSVECPYAADFFMFQIEKNTFLWYDGSSFRENGLLPYILTESGKNKKGWGRHFMKSRKDKRS